MAARPAEQACAAELAPARRRREAAERARGKRHPPSREQPPADPADGLTHVPSDGESTGGAGPHGSVPPGSAPTQQRRQPP